MNLVISIVIPTHNSQEILEVALKGIAKQKCPRHYYEVIVSDNNGSVFTRNLAKRCGAKYIMVDGNPPQVCRQRNAGVKVAKGSYILMLDHDVELSQNFIKDFVELVKRKANIDAWYIPYKIITGNSLFTRVRNFEEEFYRNSVVAAARIIRKETFWKTESQYDPQLSSGPADWDFNIQLQRIGAKFDYFEDYVYHHEEGMNFWNYSAKKAVWANGARIYKEKWRRKDGKIYKEIVERQYSPLYRLFWIFFEKGKWKKTATNIHLYLLFLGVKITMAGIYFCSQIRRNYEQSLYFRG